MITWDRLVIVPILLWLFLYTFSYGKWTWGRRNHLGAIMIFVIAFCELSLPFYLIFIRQ